MKLLPWIAPLIAAASYLAWSYVAHDVYAAGLPPFDLHPYSYLGALDYLAALTPEARAAYLGPLHRLDALLLTSLTASLILPVLRAGWAWTLPALCYAAADLLENRAVAAVLTQGLREAGEVSTIALLTTLKFAALALAAALAARSLWRNR